MPYHDEPTRYDTAQICVNGHEINSWAGSQPEFNSAFCKECGAKTITACPACSGSIRGHALISGVINIGPYDIPAHCHACGKPYPWTEVRIQVAREAAGELVNLTREEQEQLRGTIDDIVLDTPRTTLAAMRFKRLVGKAGKEAVRSFESILGSVVSKATRKMIFP
jgi:hypothetical protein